MKRFASLFLLLSFLIISSLTAQKTEKGLKDYASFPIGVAVMYEDFCANTEYRNIVSKEFNAITIAAMQMWNIQPAENVFKFNNADYLVNYANQHNIRVWGHVLMWHQYAIYLDWMKNFKGDSIALENLVRTHISTLVGRYKGKIAAWEVINECINEDGSLRSVNKRKSNTPIGSKFVRVLGKDYITRCFQYAREADPKAKLFINEYGIEWNVPKRKTYLELAKGLQAKGLIDGLGFQCHMRYNEDLSVLRSAFKEAAATGLLVQITELDVRINPNNTPNFIPTDSLLKKQAEAYQKIVAAYMECVPAPQRYGITFWNVTDKESFFSEADYPLLFDKQYQRKPSYNSFLNALSSENKLVN